MTEQVINEQRHDDEIDLMLIFKNLFKQRGLIIAFAFAFLLLGAAFQFSKLAFFAPKTVNYPVAINFVSVNKSHYPNGTAFSPEDIISPENIQSVLATSEYQLTLADVTKGISIDPTNSLIKSTRESLQSELSGKKIPNEKVVEVKEALDLLKNQATTYVTLSLDLSKVKLSEAEAKSFLKAVAGAWADNALKTGLINPNISYPQVAFTYDKSTAIIDNYDRLLSYSKDLNQAIKQLAGLKGSHVFLANGKNLNDLKRTVENIISNDIKVMRSYSYSISPALMKENQLLAIQIHSQLRVKELNKAEIQKKIATYDLILEKLNSEETVGRANSQQSLNNQSIEANMDQNVLNDLLHLGSKVSSSDLKKEIINKRIDASEKLFALEKEIDLVASNINSDEVTKSQQKMIALMPTLFERTVKEINHAQETFMQLLGEYQKISLDNKNALYSAVSSPYVTNAFGFPLKKSLVILMAAALMGLFIGCAIALLRASFLPTKNKK